MPDKPSMWKIPINFVTASGKTHTHLMNAETDLVIIKDNPTGSWVKLNNGFFGYYRTIYPSDYIGSFLQDASFKKMNELDRLNLLDDLMACVQNGNVSSVEALKMISAFKGEDSYVVWRCINNFLVKLRTIICDDPEVLSLLKKFALNLMGNIVTSVGWAPKPNEHHTKGLLRMLVISKVGQLGHPKIVKEAREKFQSHIQGTRLGNSIAVTKLELISIHF